MHGSASRAPARGRARSVAVQMHRLQKNKPASDFSHPRRDLETAFHTRCKSCETCSACNRSFADHRKMAADRKLCTKCDAQEKLKTCTVCGEKRAKNLYSTSQWTQAERQSRNLYLRCIPCHSVFYFNIRRHHPRRPPLSRIAGDALAGRGCLRRATRQNGNGWPDAKFEVTSAKCDLRNDQQRAMREASRVRREKREESREG